ncbi:hypothetical protein ASE00_10185 [Sphingomonas sp. Root710]|uniref:trypsin-like serine peptidase n=1 Tax=Sphingomonas sp. Root710 TaxID=1736594 RepID=UPI0006FD5B0A|nr:serine protease [Sphingomonas sp. Root710]KRB82424.1 hypothetical protein ASE00_10185 [Sphingomonas sp. Root710]
MAFRYLSKGGALHALARRRLLVPVAAMLLSSGTTADAIILSGSRPTDGSAMMSADDRGRFAGVGRVECRDPRTSGVAYVATGWVLGSTDTVVTAAHVFFRGASTMRAARALNPAKCAFILYDRNQQIRQEARIRYAVSPWADITIRNDSSYDVAILKLDRPIKIDSIPVAMAFKGQEKAVVDLVAFHLGVGEMQRAWITRGRLRDFPASQQRDDRAATRITNARRLFSTSADSSPGSSGGMYYDERMHAAIGVHLGAVCDQVRPRYDPHLCFNYGLRFTPAIVAMVDMVVRDQPAPANLIVADGEPSLAEARPVQRAVD